MKLVLTTDRAVIAIRPGPGAVYAMTMHGDESDAIVIRRRVDLLAWADPHDEDCLIADDRTALTDRLLAARTRAASLGRPIAFRCARDGHRLLVGEGV